MKKRTELEILTDLEKCMASIEKLLLSQQEYLNLSELTQYLGLDRETAAGLIDTGTFTLYKPNGKIICVRRKEVDGWLENSKQKGPRARPS